jgi:hypothetical protein
MRFKVATEYPPSAGMMMAMISESRIRNDLVYNVILLQ